MAMTMPTSMNTNMDNYCMHNSFYWGNNVIILFPNWPGHSPRMYILSLLFIFLAAATSELLSVFATAAGARGHAGRVSILAAYSHTCVYAVRVGLSFIVMLSVMSFNVGVFVAAVAGHALGFLAMKVSSHKRSKFEQDEEEEQTPSFVH